MSEPLASTDARHEAGRYEIRLKGHLEARWAARFDGLSLAHERDGTTSLAGAVVDQAALHGLLQKVRDTALPLVSVAHVRPESTATSTSPAEPQSFTEGEAPPHRRRTT